MRSESTLYQIKKTGKIRLGVYSDGVPFSYFDAKTKKYIGYAMDICKVIVDEVKEQLKMKKLCVEYVPLTYENRFDKMVNNEYDLECDGSTNTKLR